MEHLYDEQYVREQLDEFEHLYKQLVRTPAQYKKITRSRLIPMQDAMERHRADLACVKGCALCCYLRVEAHAYEIVAIYYHILTTYSDQQKAEFLARLREAAERIRPLNPLEHYRTNIRCPMLVDNACSIYTVRPMACAGFYSVTLEACQYQHENPDDLATAAPGIAQLNTDTQLEREIAEMAIHSLRHDNNRYEIVTALEALFAKPALIAKWRKGKVIF